MINVLIASNNVYYAKAIMDILDNKYIKVSNLAIDGIETLGLIRTKSNIDIVILELELANYNGIKIINTLIKNNMLKYRKSFIIISKNKNLLEKLKDNQYVFDTIDRKENLYSLKIKVEKLLHKKLKEKRITELKYEITKEVKYLSYNLSYKGTKYLIDIVELLLLNKNQDYSNLKKDVYPIIANKYKTTVHNIKNNIVKATEQMYIECESKRLQQYFGFANDYKPTTKNVIYTIYSKITEKDERKHDVNSERNKKIM